MPTTRCTCGKLIVVPAGKPAPASCPACKAPLGRSPAPAKGATAARPRPTLVRKRKSRVGAWIAAGISLAVLGTVALGLVGAYVLKPADKYRASGPESADDRAEAARDAFAYKAETIDETKDRAAIDQVLHQLISAGSGSDESRVTPHVHLPRLLAELRAIPGFPRIRTRIEETQVITALRTAVARALMSGPVRWSAVKVTRVRHARGRPEADAYSRVSLQDGETAKIRFRLIKEDGVWRMFDWEAIEEGTILSQLLARAVALAQNPDGAAHLQAGSAAFEKVVNLLRSGKLAEAERAAADAGSLNLPEHMRALLAHLEGAAIAGQGRFAEAIVRYDAALKQKPDFHAALLLKSSALCNLQRFAEAATLASQYLDLVGDDEQAWANLSVCKLSQGDLPGAEEAALNSLRTDPATDDAWTALEAVYEQAGKRDALAMTRRRVLPAGRILAPKASPIPSPSASSTPLDQDEQQVLQVVGRMVQASERRDAVAFAAELDTDRLIDTASRCDEAPPMHDGVRGKLAALIKEQFVPGFLSRPERWLVPFPMSCRFTAPGREAILIAVIHQPEAKRSLVRFRVIKGPGGWKVYDWEEPSRWLRLSRVIGVLYPDAGIEPALAARWRDGAAACLGAAEAFATLTPDRAMAEYQKAVTSNIPACFKAVLDLLAAEVFIRTSKWREAEDLARKGMGRHPDAAWGRRLVARSQFGAGDPAKAIGTWKSVFDLQGGEDPWTHAWLAEAYLKSKHPTKAEEHATIAVKMYSQLDKAWDLLIQALEANDRHADAAFVRKNGRLPPGK